MFALTCVLLLATIVLVAVFRKDYVKFILQFMGARVHLEVKGRK
jgi:hypothetical protein